MSEYKELLNKYNRLVTKTKDLREQLEVKSELLAQRDKEYKVIDKNIRELLEEILAKDPKEMKLGSEYSWDNIKLLELIKKAKKAYEEAGKENAKILNGMLRENEKRTSDIYDFQQQIAALKRDPDNKKAIEEEENRQKTQSKLANSENALNKAVLKKGLEVIFDDDSDFSDEEQKLLDATIEDSKMVKATYQQIAVDKTKEEKIKKKREQKVVLMVEDIQKTVDNLSEIEKKIVELIGSKGVSRQTQIIKSIDAGSDTDVRKAIGSLCARHILKRRDLALPLISKFIIVRLSEDFGVPVYKKLCDGKEPAPSEWGLVCAEHDNEIHGYGIITLAEELKKTSYYKDIQTYNRSNPIQTRNGKEYVPDIVLKCKNGSIMYLEYELGTHSKEDFFEKLNKILSFSNTVDIIAVNDNAAKTNIIPKVKQYLAEKDGEDNKLFFKNKKIRIDLATRAARADLTLNEAWKYVWKPYSSKEMIVNE